VKIKINHKMADAVSVATGIGTYSGESQSELAFFNDGQWVTAPIPEFEEYHDGAPFDSESCVYPWVPNEKIENFLTTYRV
jgi:hypothetical protein